MRVRIFVAVLAGAILCVFQSAVLADGLRSPAPFSWSGLYIGGYVGGAWGDSDLRTDAGNVVVGSSYFQSAANIASVNQGGSGAVSPDAVVGGAQIGFNVQQGKWVAGVELDFGAFNLNGAREAVNVPYPVVPPGRSASFTERAAIDTDWLLTARARLGWALQPGVLVYATGGLALTNLRVSNAFSDNAPSAGVGGGSNTDVVTGWTLGGGAELALSKHWSLKAEYLYVDFGSTTTRNSVACGPAATINCASVPVIPSPFSTSADLSAHIARLGLNYRF
jgi:outer membrane immunogenic protein